MKPTTMRRRLTPRQAMSARQVDRMEKGLVWAIRRMDLLYDDADLLGRRRRAVQVRLYSIANCLRRLLLSVRRSERR